MTRVGRAALVLALCVLPACAARRVALPSGPGSPFPEFAAALDEATAACRGVTSLTASLGLSGRTGSTGLRGRIDAGLAAPARLRLEGYPPVIYGSKPFFIMVARGEEATLVLPRDDRVLLGARPEEIVDALAGVPLGPLDLRSVLAGCGLPAAAVADARSFPNGWASLSGGDTTTYLRQVEGRWRVAAAVRGSLTVQYLEYAGDRPGTVSVRTAAADRSRSTDLTLKLSDVELNVPLEDRVFEIVVPPGAAPLTLDELRRSGPLGGGPLGGGEEVRGSGRPGPGSL